MTTEHIDNVQCNKAKVMILSDRRYEYFTEEGARIGAIIACLAETAYKMDVPAVDLLNACLMTADQVEQWIEAESAIKQ